MQVLVSAVGTRGDVQPAVAVALEVRRLGHDVRLCVSPNFVEWVGELGFKATPVGVEMRYRGAGAASSAPATAPTPEQLRQMRETMPDLITDQFDAVGSAAKGCDVLLGAGGHQYAARSIAEANGIPYVNAVYAPVSLPSPDHAPPPAPGQAWEFGQPADNQERWLDNAKVWNARALERINRNRERLGLRPVDDVHGHIRTDHPWLAADPTLAPLPRTPGMQVLQTGAWILTDSRPLPPELEDFLDDGEPPIYLGFGSMPASENTSRTLIDAARAVGRRAILSQGWAELGLIDDAPGSIAIGDVNHQALFPRVAAVVHHGGAGTTTVAARAGAPQVVAPMFSDQFYWAERTRALGIGAPPPRGTLTTDAPAAALHAALRPAIADHARSVAAAIVIDGATTAARRLVAESKTAAALAG
jgi:vancomycin aglycone glucosyltransferase